MDWNSLFPRFAERNFGGGGSASHAVDFAPMTTAPEPKPCGGSIGPRSPDFYEIEGNFPVGSRLPQYGPGGGLTVDRYGRVYAGVSGAFGLPTAAGASFTVGWMTTWRSPTPSQLSSFLTGHSGQGGGGYWLGGSYTSTLNSGSAVSVGAMTPGAALKRQYGWQIGQIGTNQCGN